MFEPPRLRLALAVGDQELEQRLRPALDAFDDLLVAVQCLAADQVLHVLAGREVDALIVASNLHRLTDAVLLELERPGLPLVLLVPDPEDERWKSRRDPTLALDADAEAIRDALLSARSGERIVRRAQADRVALKTADRPVEAGARVIAVTGGFGSPGRTTVAISLAAALGTVAPAVLVELDLCESSVAAFLDRDPSRNICTLAHAVRDDPRAWPIALQAELQPIAQHSSTADVLCGPPKREMRATVAPNFVERLISELGAEYRWIVLDVGPELTGMEAAATSHRLALSRADQVLLVVGADLVGLWHARTALDQLERHAGVDRQHVSLVLNRFDARHHHAASEVQWHLGASVLGVVPFDHHAAQRAIGAQQPLVADPRGRASRALLQVAERINEGKLRAPRASDARRGGRPWWRRLMPGQRVRVTARTLPQPDRVPVAAPRGRGDPAW